MLSFFGAFGICFGAKVLSVEHFLLTRNHLSLREFSGLSENARPFFLFSAIQSFMAGFFCVLTLPKEPQAFTANHLPNREQIEVCFINALTDENLSSLISNTRQRNVLGKLVMIISLKLLNKFTSVCSQEFHIQNKINFLGKNLRLGCCLVCMIRIPQ